MGRLFNRQTTDPLEKQLTADERRQLEVPTASGISRHDRAALIISRRERNKPRT